MNRLLQLREQVISKPSLEANELNTLLFGVNYERRDFSRKILRDNKEFRHHFHLKDYPLEEIRRLSFEKLLASYKNAPDIEKTLNLDMSIANKVSLYTSGFPVNDYNFCILGGVHTFLYSRALYLLGT